MRFIATIVTGENHVIGRPGRDEQAMYAVIEAQGKGAVGALIAALKAKHVDRETPPCGEIRGLDTEITKLLNGGHASSPPSCGCKRPRRRHAAYRWQWEGGCTMCRWTYGLKPATSKPSVLPSTHPCEPV